MHLKGMWKEDEPVKHKDEKKMVRGIFVRGASEGKTVD